MKMKSHRIDFKLTALMFLNALRTISSLIHNFHGYNFVLLLLEWYAEECAHPLLIHSNFGFEDLNYFLLRRFCQSWNENFYPFEEGINQRGVYIQRDNENRKFTANFPRFETLKLLKYCGQEGVFIRLANNITYRLLSVPFLFLFSSLPLLIQEVSR
jgi:hypothetical protein